MIANAFEQIRSIGKTPCEGGTSSSKISQTSLEQQKTQQKQQSDNLIRDPRLSKRLTESQQPLPPPPPPSSSSSKEIFEKKNGNVKIEEIDEEKVDKDIKKGPVEANIKNEPTEILHETLPMDISCGGDALATSLQMYFSSPEEPMEEDEQINIENSTKENKITIKEGKEIKKEQETVDNISGIAGGEMPMDLC
uniref:Uncharacterized protein n=1 Tax=Meloidogyne incognita TaxID=6306 RepID=A0A914MXR6_MELIC